MNPWHTRERENYVSALRAQATWLERAEEHETQQWLFTSGACRLPLGSFNSAVRLAPALSAEDFLAQAAVWFAERRAGFCVSLPDEEDADLEACCSEHGMLRLDDLSVLSLTERLPLPSKLASLKLDVVRDRAGLARFASVVGAAYAVPPMPRELVAATFENPERLLVPEVQLLVATREEQPVAAALLLETAKTGGIYWVATVPEERGRGIATRLLSALVNAGFDRGLERIVLQAAPSAAGLYQRLGFDSCGHIRRFSWPFPSRLVRRAV